MIYEMRTYDLKPRSLPEVEKRFGKAYEYRKKFSPLAAFWHTEFGPLNQIIHVWPYQDLVPEDRYFEAANMLAVTGVLVADPDTLDFDPWHQVTKAELYLALLNARLSFTAGRNEGKQVVERPAVEHRFLQQKYGGRRHQQATHPWRQ